MNRLKKILMVNIPLWAVVIVMSCTAVLGMLFVDRPVEPAPFASVSKLSIMFEAAAKNPSMNEDLLKKTVVNPTNELLGEYAAKGYTVIDTSKDQCGNFTIAAIPEQAINLNEELRKRLHVESK